MSIVGITSSRAVVAIPAVLAVGNGAWSLMSGRTAPLMAMAAYAVVALVILRSRDYRAGVIVGIAGFAIHVLEAAIHGTASLGTLERVWLFANIVLPLVLVYLSWLLLRRSRSPGAKTREDGGSN